MSADRSPSYIHRADTRRKLVLRTAAFNALARVVSIAANLAQIPIALHYLKNEAFGLWMVCSSMIQLMSFADLGIGLGLQNKVSTAYGQDDHKAIRDLFTTGTHFLALLACGLVCVALPLCFFIPWENWLNISDPALATQIAGSMVVIVLGFSIGLPLNIGARFASALQQGWLIGIWTAVGSALSLVLTAMVAGAQLGFTFFIVVTVIAPIVANLGTMWSLFRLTKPTLGRLKGVHTPSLLRDLLKQGLLFLTPQISATIFMAAPAVIIASILGPVAVTPFSLCQRLSGLLLQFQAMPLTPLWPAYAEACSRGDSEWILTTLRKSLAYAIGSGLILGGGLWLGGEYFLSWWAPSVLSPSLTATLAGFAVWTFSVCSMTAVTVFLNGCGLLKGQAVGGAGAAVTVLCAMPSAVMHFGSSSAIYVMLGACLFIGWPYVVIEFARGIRSIRLASAVAQDRKLTNV